MEDRLVITIDGPAGVGKSTVSKALAEKLSYLYLDTGALYRAIAYKVIAEGISVTDKDTLQSFLERMKIRCDNSKNRLRVFVNSEDVTDKIRTEEISIAASKISAIPMVRKALLHIQRNAAAQGGVVAEGRDMGTVVFPDANVKFFLEAVAEERIRRRYDELLLRGEGVDYHQLATDMAARDKQDRERPLAPLMAHPDAVFIDSTTKSVPEVIDCMMSTIKEHLTKHASDRRESNAKGIDREIT
jgi:CMP/dCMP kinase